MNEALAWIGQIAEWVGKFIPRWMVVDSTHGWVKFVRGSEISSGGGNIVWWWPATTNIHTYPIARQTINLKSQIITTLDNKSVAVGGMMVYVVGNVEKLLTQTYAPDSVLADIGLAAIHDVCSGLTWDEIIEAQRDGDLDSLMRKQAAKDLKDYGVRVKRFTLTDLAPARVIKLINEGDHSYSGTED